MSKIIEKQVRINLNVSKSDHIDNRSSSSSEIIQGEGGGGGVQPGQQQQQQQRRSKTSLKSRPKSSRLIAPSAKASRLPPIMSNTIMTTQKSNNNNNNNYSNSIGDVQQFTCHRLNENKQLVSNYCGVCSSCEIVRRLAQLKQWFDRASHATQKKLLTGLLARIRSPKAYEYLNDVLKPLSNYSKDFIYSRNKYLPSLDNDALKVTNDRCLTKAYVNKQINELWAWYLLPSTNDYEKINFFLGMLQRCEQSVVLFTVQNLKEMLQELSMSTGESSMRTIRFGDAATINSSILTGDDTESEMIYEASSDDDDLVDAEARRAIRSDEFGNTYIDFIRYLPVHLSKKILSMLSKKQLYKCLFVCKYWCNLVKEVHKEGFLHKILIDDMMLLKGTSSKGTNPRYANNVDVRVPNLVPGTNELILNPDEAQVNTTFKSECNWTSAYAGFSTRNVIMEERNVLCGQYNVLVMKEKHDRQRVCHLNGPSTIAFSSSLDQKLRFIDLKTAQDRTLTIQGHAASIRCVYIYEKKRIVITGSYDTSVRVWSIDTGKCLRIFQGHQQTVSCLSMHEDTERVITGSVDRTCRVWLLSRKKCWRTFKHRYQIVSVAMGEEVCVTGGRTGKIRLFDLLAGKLIKKISAHQGPVNQVRFDRWHIVSCGSDCFAQVFSTQGRHAKCLMAMRHPKPVLCLEFLYLRAITGSADGKLRIWNVLNGECLRVMRGNSQCDAILSISLTSDVRRLLVNTENHILLMEFEHVEYDYASSPYLNKRSSTLVDGVGAGWNESGGEDEATGDEGNEVDGRKRHSRLKRGHSTSKSYSCIRASRSELLATPNARLFNTANTTTTTIRGGENSGATAAAAAVAALGMISPLVLDHSARPISAHNLKHAEIVHRVTSSARPLNIYKNSIGDISDFALKKRLLLVNSINATILAKKSSIASSVARLPSAGIGDKKISTELSSMATSSADDLSRPDATAVDHHHAQPIDSISASRFRAREFGSDELITLNVNLNETKQILRDQLQERRQLEQTIEGRKKLQMSSDTEVRSCVDRKRSDKSRLEERPRSSPSRIDSRTRIRLNSNELERIRSGVVVGGRGQKTNVDSNTVPQQPAATTTTATTQKTTSQLWSSSSHNASKLNRTTTEFIKMVYVLPPSRPVTRARSAHHLKSKYNQSEQETNHMKNKKSLKMKGSIEGGMEGNKSRPNWSVARAKTALPFRHAAMRQQASTAAPAMSLIATSTTAPVLFRPATSRVPSASTFLTAPPSMMTRSRPNTTATGKWPTFAHQTMTQSMSALAGSANSQLPNDQLNLMTFKQVERLVDQINGVCGNTGNVASVYGS